MITEINILGKSALSVYIALNIILITIMLIYAIIGVIYFVRKGRLSEETLFSCMFNPGAEVFEFSLGFFVTINCLAIYIVIVFYIYDYIK